MYNGKEAIGLDIVKARGYSTTQVTGAWTSFGNNQVIGNAGTAPTAAGAASTDLGQK